MLSVNKLKQLGRSREMSIENLAGHIARAGLDKTDAISAMKNWRRGLMKPVPRKQDIQRLASALGVKETDLSDWHCCYYFAPMSARKVRLVTQLIAGRPTQNAIDLLKFTRKRAASMVNQVLKSAIADADEQQADVDSLYVSEARVDDAGVRAGTKRFEEKDRGKAYAIRQRACHIHVTVTEK